MTLRERPSPARPGALAAVTVALLVLGRGLSIEGSATLLATRWPDLLLTLLVWIRVVGVALAAGVGAGLLAARAVAPKAPRPSLSRSAAWAAVIATTAAGAGLRWAPEALLPFRLWADTLFCIRPALRTPGQVPWYGGTWFGDDVSLGDMVAPNAYAAGADLVLDAFGAGETGLLALTALPSIATILAAAWLAAELRGRESAVAAAILVALSGWPIVHGRWGYTSVALVPLAVAGASALVRAGRVGSVAWAALGGVLAGATVHTYPAAWPFLATITSSTFVAWRREAGGRRLLVGAGAGVLAAVLLAAPSWIGRPDRIGGRANEVWLGAPVKDTSVPRGGEGLTGLPVRLAYNCWHYAALLVGETDPNPRHYLPGRAPIPVLVGVLAIVGAAVLRDVPVHARWILTGLGAGGFLAGVAASPAAVPNTQRTPLFLVAALVLAALAATALPRTRPGLLAVTGLLAVGLVANDVRLVLGPWARDRIVEGAFLPIEVEAGRILSRVAPARLVIVNGSISSPFAVEVLAAAGSGRPVPTSLRICVEDLAAGGFGSERAFWILARREDLESVDPERFKLGRGVPPGLHTASVVLARGVRRVP